MRNGDFKKFLANLFSEHKQDDFPNIKVDKNNATFHITVTDNSTGNKVVDSDTSCIIGSYDASSNGTGIMVFAKANDLELAATTRCAQKAVKYVLDDNPMIRLLCAMAEEKE